MTPPTRVPTRFRGTLVAALSIVISIAAHGTALHRSHPVGHGHHDATTAVPGPAAIGALLLAAALLAVLVTRATRRRPGPTALAGLLVTGQAAGHLALSLGAAETGHPLLPSATMLFWHGAAVLASAVLILFAETAVAAVTTVRAAVRAARTPISAPTPGARLPVRDRSAPVRLRHGVRADGCRAPPLPV